KRVPVLCIGVAAISNRQSAIGTYLADGDVASLAWRRRRRPSLTSPSDGSSRLLGHRRDGASCPAEK
ncbi:MAG: hypothetical protein KJO17_13710, partial [Acidimicrobiia bacterium]|nr:hypothetical protein [Acidimicrobiia bacterium]